MSVVARQETHATFADWFEFAREVKLTHAVFAAVAPTRAAGGVATVITLADYESPYFTPAVFVPGRALVVHVVDGNSNQILLNVHLWARFDHDGVQLISAAEVLYIVFG